MRGLKVCRARVKPNNPLVLFWHMRTKASKSDLTSGLCPFLKCFTRKIERPKLERKINITETIVVQIPMALKTWIWSGKQMPRRISQIDLKV